MILNNLDKTKKIITIYTGKIDYIWSKVKDPLERTLLKEKSFLNTLIQKLKQLNFNVIFKSHPSGRSHVKNNKLVIDRNFPGIDHFVEKNLVCSIDFIDEVYNDYYFIDNSFYNEIYKYSDYAIVFSFTSARDQLYIYDTPCLAIDTKDDTSWTHPKLRHNGYPDKITSSHKEYVEKYNFGKYIYHEDFNDAVLDEFLKIKIDSYKYLNIHLLFEDTYSSTNEKVVDLIIDKSF